MSKKSKALSKASNLQKKRAIKAANRARYQELARIGQNTKSVRARRALKHKTVARRADHANGNCGNFACSKCFGQYHLKAA
jgi:hypothetical protein